jgi:hypothetical protein
MHCVEMSGALNCESVGGGKVGASVVILDVTEWEEVHDRRGDTAAASAELVSYVNNALVLCNTMFYSTALGPVGGCHVPRFGVLLATHSGRLLPSPWLYSPFDLEEASASFFAVKTSVERDMTHFIEGQYGQAPAHRVRQSRDPLLRAMLPALCFIHRCLGETTSTTQPAAPQGKVVLVLRPSIIEDREGSTPTRDRKRTRDGKAVAISNADCDGDDEMDFNSISTASILTMAPNLGVAVSVLGGRGAEALDQDLARVINGSGGRYSESLLNFAALGEILCPSSDDGGAEDGARGPHHRQLPSHGAGRVEGDRMSICSRCLRPLQQAGDQPQPCKLCCGPSEF